MYRLLIKLIIITILLDLGLSSSSALEGCLETKDCLVRLREYRRQLLKVEWKPIIISEKFDPEWAKIEPFRVHW